MKDGKIKTYKSGSLKTGLIELVIGILILVLDVVFMISYKFYNAGLIILYVAFFIAGGFMTYLALIDIKNGRFKKILLRFGIKDVGKLLKKTKVSGLKKTMTYKYQYRYQNKDYVMEEVIDPKLFDHYNEGKNVPILVYDSRAMIDYEKIFGKNYYNK